MISILETKCHHYCYCDYYYKQDITVFSTNNNNFMAAAIIASATDLWNVFTIVVYHYHHQ